MNASMECGSYWLEKTTHVHAIYPANCTDDLAFIEANNCTELLWPKVFIAGTPERSKAGVPSSLYRLTFMRTSKITKPTEELFFSLSSPKHFPLVGRYIMMVSNIADIEQNHVLYVLVADLYFFVVPNKNKAPHLVSKSRPWCLFVF